MRHLCALPIDEALYYWTIVAGHIVEVHLKATPQSLVIMLFAHGLELALHDGRVTRLFGKAAETGRGYGCSSHGLDDIAR